MKKTLPNKKNEILGKIITQQLWVQLTESFIYYQ
tara:strand:+ start:186 stop:287 length:102 start_codon:yes stop_codon:yes gene_type:complete